jgi:hypothetical protein
MLSKPALELVQAAGIRGSCLLLSVDCEASNMVYWRRVAEIVWLCASAAAV